MKISAKARYGLRILVDLALHGNDAPRSIKDIAKSQQISEKFISRLVVELRRAGFIRSIRGTQGGLKLARFPRLITLLNIVETMDGPISLLDCITSPQACPRQKQCVVTDVWSEINQALINALSAITLEDVVKRYPPGQQFLEDYCI